jgi:hypothetical protein
MKRVSTAILLSLLAEEKDQITSYRSLCARYEIQPDPVAEAGSRGRQEALKSLLGWLRGNSSGPPTLQTLSSPSLLKED